MAFTRPKAAQIDFDLTNITDPIIRLNSGQSGSADKDVGIVIERGSDTNVALLYDESADEFVLVNTSEDGTTSGNVTISSYADLKVGQIYTTGEVNIGGNLTVQGTTTSVDVTSINITNSFSFEGATADGFETTLTVADPTADRTITLPDVTGYAAIFQSDPGTTLVTATVAELNYVDGVTSAIQTQIDNISSSFTLSDNQGTPNTDTFTTGQTLTFAGSTGIDTTVSDNQVAIAIDSTVATLTGSQTLTNKTLTTPIISSISNTGTLTLPTSTDTLVGRATTDTLTNKTLTSPQINTNADLLARGEVRFYDTDSSNYVALRASGTVTSNLTFSLPTAYGDNEQVLTTDGAGGTSWTTVSGGGGSSGFVNSTTTTVPASSGNYDLAEGPAQDGDETPFEAGAVDAFGVNLGTIYDCMEPTGSLNTVDYGDSEAYVGA